MHTHTDTQGGDMNTQSHACNPPKAKVRMECACAIMTLTGEYAEYFLPEESAVRGDDMEDVADTCDGSVGRGTC
mgnify:CR=1 FL=1